MMKFIYVLLVAIALGTISVTYSNPVPTVAEDNNLATEASASESIQEQEEANIEKGEEESTSAPLSPNAEEDEHVATYPSPADSDAVEGSQSEVSNTDDVEGSQSGSSNTDDVEGSQSGASDTDDFEGSQSGASDTDDPLSQSGESPSLSTPVDVIVVED
ncbi:hypothetical protein ACJMK2_030430 [Sinanodonta woodiana]|uniref:Uncharacterized protein n=1 Tax=Sinanodonta woodiana TaxID=1069815 RepID=A0ABD3XD53_SINWO